MVRHLGQPDLPGQPVSLKGKEGKGRTKPEFYAKFFKRFLKLLPHN